MRRPRAWATASASARACAALAALAALAACSSGTRSGVPAPAPASAAPSSTTASSTVPGATAATSTTTTASTAGAATTAAWPTYNRTDDRAGDGVGVPRPAALTTGWTEAVDGAVYGQALIVGSTVVAATENDTVYAFDLGTGALRWRQHLGAPMTSSQLPCGDISPLGITGTPAYDAATGSVFVAAETSGGAHDLVALDTTTGQVRWRSSLDIGGHNRVAQQQRGALAVAGGRVYVAFGGLYGDCGDYVGYVTATPTSGAGATTHYAVPTAREGGIWASSGPAIAADGTVYVAAGNGASTGGAYDGSDAVIRLAPDLSSRLDFFAPSAWAEQNASDTDLGSTGPLLVAGGLVVQSGKDGNVYVLDAGHLGGIGGSKAHTGGCRGFGGMAADASAVFVPCTDGLRRFDVSPTAITPRWRVPVTGPPVVGGGAVWSLDTGSGVLHAYDEASGANLASAHVGGVTRFTAPVVAGNVVVVGTHATVVELHIRAA